MCMCVRSIDFSSLIYTICLLNFRNVPKVWYFYLFILLSLFHFNVIHRKMLELGSSKPWQEAMFVMTGTRNMSALPLVEYFTPLVDWLKEHNNGENIGWSESCPTNIPLPTTNNVPPFVSSFGCFLILASILIDLLH